MSLVHLAQGSPDLSTLDGYRIAIVREVDGVALRVGRLLREARQAEPDLFDAWVVNELPFGLETSRRLMSISAAYEKLPPEMLEQLPRPWQAMYALKALPAAVITAGVEAGEIHPAMTVEGARRWAKRWKNSRRDKLVAPLLSRADIVAGTLMGYHSEDLTIATRAALRSWLDAPPPPAA